ncbi:alpha/beta fold hydrolase [Sutcliffiella sp. NC1]|uniref:alpha/beta fold hydrolase n=1 Tax=Sutcliffiella sp. NC1 TaxID=3004096 RepID=UPI0022DDEE8B|nr:alpha/beta hydrolase [Sutcliffiella sp. NC1]WBL14297.1 alpha/beta hydrolase [Sutcliffiella sp. NC1]
MVGEGKAFTKNLLGVDVYYELYPNKDATNKPVMVLIHGFLSSSFSYRRLFPLLKKDYTVLSVDLPPFGKSGKQTTFVYSYENMAKLVLHLLQSLSFHRAIVVGHSMGGQIALNMSKLKPDIVEKCILLCSSGYQKRMSNSLIVSSRIPFFHMWVKYWLGRKGILGNLYNVVYDRSLVDDEMVSGYLQPFTNDDIFRALTRMIRDREGDLAAEELKGIETPNLLIWGEEDRVVPLPIGVRLSNDLPNSKLITYKKTGHLLPEEKPDYVTENILEFAQS